MLKIRLLGTLVRSPAAALAYGTAFEVPDGSGRCLHQLNPALRRRDASIARRSASTRGLFCY